MLRMPLPTFNKISESTPEPDRLIYAWVDGVTVECVWDDDVKAFCYCSKDGPAIHNYEFVTHWIYAEECE